MTTVIREGVDRIADRGPATWGTFVTPEDRTVEVWCSGERRWQVNFPGGGENVEEAREWLERRSVPLSFDDETAVTVELDDHSRDGVSEFVAAYLQSVGAESISIERIERSEAPTSEEAEAHSGEDAPLESSRRTERWSAAADMVSEGRNLNRATPILGEAFRSEDVDWSHRAEELLEQAGRPAVPEFVKTLDETDDPDKQTIAIEKLGKLGEVARPAVPKLIDLLDGSTPSVRFVAASAIVDITENEHSQLVAPVFADAIREPPDEEVGQAWRVRFSAVLKLVTLKEKAEPAVDALLWLIQQNFRHKMSGPTQAMCALASCVNYPV